MNRSISDDYDDKKLCMWIGSRVEVKMDSAVH